MPESLTTQFQTDFQGLSLIDSSKKPEYERPFFNHLDSLNKYDLLFTKEKSSFQKTVKDKFSLSDYLGLEQFVMENTHLVEPTEMQAQEIDWNEIDNAKDFLQDKINKLLGHEQISQTLKPLIEFTIDSFENYAIYTYMHPKSTHNPWMSTHHLLLSGYMYLISDKEELVKEFHPTLYGQKNNQDENVGIITKAKKERKFKGVILDNRLTIQMLVLNYLKKIAPGYENPIPKKRILQHIEEKGITYSDSSFNTAVLLPLKRTLLIGSSSRGYYYMEDNDDFKTSYKFHQSKYAGIEFTMNIYKEGAASRGISL